MSALVMSAFPVASSWTVISTHCAVGGVLSRMVKSASQVEILLLISSTVSTAVTVPVSAQIKEFGVTESGSKGQASLLPLSISEPCMIAVPAPSRETVISWQRATGTMLSITSTSAVHCAVLLLASVAVSEIVAVPTSKQSKFDWDKLKES